MIRRLWAWLTAPSPAERLRRDSLFRLVNPIRGTPEWTRAHNYLSELDVPWKTHKETI